VNANSTSYPEKLGGLAYQTLRILQANKRIRDTCGSGCGSWRVS
jgi:hypothetical protein